MKKLLLSLFVSFALAAGISPAAVTTGTVEVDQYDGASWVGHRLNPSGEVQLWGHSAADVPTAYPLLSLDLATFGSASAFDAFQVPFSTGTGQVFWSSLPPFEPPDGTRGDITVSQGIGFPTPRYWTIVSGAVTLAKMAPLAANSLMGNATGSAATPSAISINTALNMVGGSAATGDILYLGLSSTWTRLAKGTTGYPLLAGSLGPVYGQLDLAGSGVTGTLPGSAVGTGINAANITSGTLPSGRIGAGSIGATQLDNTGVTPGTYTSVTVDANGRTTAGSNVSGGTVDSRLYSADATWTNPSPSTPKRIYYRLVSGGGGGGSGRKGAAASVRCGGGGGASGVVVSGWALTTDFGATESITVGLGGAGGASVTANSTSGNNGGAGGNSSLGSFVKATGGNLGGGGTGSAGAAGAALSSGNVVELVRVNGSGGGAASGIGGAGSGGTAMFVMVPTGGAAGGGISSANAAAAGGNGGALGDTNFGLVAGGAGGAVNTNGSNGTSAYGSGTGGGGGGGSTTGSAGAGGAGAPGAGGGGGGAAVDGVGDSGAGGAGGNGYILIITYL